METLFSPSKASPPVIAPSPIIATTLLAVLFSKRAAAVSAKSNPRAAEMLLLACPATKASCSLSAGEGNGDNPLNCLLVWNRSLRPVIILCAYAWCPTSHTNLSSGVLKT